MLTCICMMPRCIVILGMCVEEKYSPNLLMFSSKNQNYMNSSDCPLVFVLVRNAFSRKLSGFFTVTRDFYKCHSTCIICIYLAVYYPQSRHHLSAIRTPRDIVPRGLIS